MSIAGRDISKTLYVSDMDGTLLDLDSKISTRSREMLNQAIRSGAKFTVATARTPATVVSLLSGIDINLPAIVMTGSALWNFNESRFFNPMFIPRECVERMREVYESHKLPYFIYTLHNDKVIRIYHRGSLSDIEQEFIGERSSTPFKEMAIPTDGNSELPRNLDNVLLFYSMQPSGNIERVYDTLRTTVDCNPFYYHDIFGEDTGILEVFAPGCDKAAAVRRMASETGAERIVVFGDNVNDIPMMRQADVAVAVGNAAEVVRKEASVVIGCNYEDAVAQWILDDMGCPSKQ